MEKFRNKYRIESTRLQKWDYRWNGAYFITICTKNRENYFGEIDPQQVVMQFSNIGIIANIMWYEIKNHANNIELGKFVVMPNHTHGILILKNNNYDINNATDDVVGNVMDDATGNATGNAMGNAMGNVETGHALSLHHHHHHHHQPPHHHQQPPSPQHQPQSSQPFVKSQSQKTIGQQRFQNIGKNSISSIIGSYKSAVTKHANRLGFDFGWQPRYYDHIIRNGAEFQRIQQYITNNPEKWYNDKFYKKGK